MTTLISLTEKLIICLYKYNNVIGPYFIIFTLRPAIQPFSILPRVKGQVSVVRRVYVYEDMKQDIFFPK